MRALVFIEGAESDGSAECDAIFGAGLDLDAVFFIARGGEGGLPRAPAGELRLDVGFGEVEAGWATVDHDSYAWAVGFASAV